MLEPEKVRRLLPCQQHFRGQHPCVMIMPVFKANQITRRDKYWFWTVHSHTSCSTDHWSLSDWAHSLVHSVANHCRPMQKVWQLSALSHSQLMNWIIAWIGLCLFQSPGYIKKCSMTSIWISRQRRTLHTVSPITT